MFKLDQIGSKWIKLVMTWYLKHGLDKHGLYKHGLVNHGLNLSLKQPTRSPGLTFALVLLNTA